MAKGFKDRLAFKLCVGGIIVAIAIFIIIEIFIINIDNAWNYRVEPMLSGIYVFSIPGYFIIGILIFIVSTILFLLLRYFTDLSWKKTINPKPIINNNFSTSTDLLSYANSALMEINSGISEGKCLHAYLDILPEALERKIITEDNARNVLDKLGYRMVKMPDDHVVFLKKTKQTRRRTK
jgi:hypothetical protein